jgi:sirohydrochlorin ferrochelatase
MTSLVVFAHGSSIESANESVRRVSGRLAAAGGYPMVEAAFLGGGRPELPEAVDGLVKRGATRIVVIPYFLTLGLHLERDLPALIANVADAHPGLDIEMTPPLDGHPALLDALLDRAAEALASAGERV